MRKTTNRLYATYKISSVTTLIRTSITSWYQRRVWSWRMWILYCDGLQVVSYGEATFVSFDPISLHRKAFGYIKVLRTLITQGIMSVLRKIRPCQTRIYRQPKRFEMCHQLCCSLCVVAKKQDCWKTRRMANDNFYTLKALRLYLEENEIT